MILSELFSSLCWKSSPELSKLYLRSLGRLWGKKHVWNFAHCFKFPCNFRQKNKSVLQKFFFRVVTNAIRASTGKFCGKSILLPEELCSLFEIWICSNFFCPVANKLSRWAKTVMHVFRGNVCGNFTLKNYFFQLFGIWAEKLGLFPEKNGTFVKTVAKVFVRRNFRKKVFG